MRLTVAAAVVDEYVSTERCTPSALLLFVFGPEPTPADCSLATEKRAAHRLRVGCEAATPFSCVTIQLIDRFTAACCRGGYLEFRDHAVFDFKSDGPSRRILSQKSNDLVHRILKSEKIQSDFAFSA